jgi:thymidylate synthase
MNNIDKQYIDLLQDILDNGVEKKDRTGTIYNLLNKLDNN